VARETAIGDAEEDLATCIINNSGPDVKLPPPVYCQAGLCCDACKQLTGLEL